MRKKNRKCLLGIIFVTLRIIPVGIQIYKDIYKPIISNTAKKESLNDSAIRAYNQTNFDIILKRCGSICLLLVPVGIILIIMGDREDNKKKK